MQNAYPTDGWNDEGRTCLERTGKTVINEREFSDDDLAEFDAEAYYAVAEALEQAEKGALELGLTRADLARKMRIDKGTVTRVLGGSQRNITMKTLVTFMRAMNRKVFISSCSLDDLHSLKPNFCFQQDDLKSGTITIYPQASASAPNATVYKTLASTFK